MTPVEVPKVGNTVEECMVGEWRKHKGDLVTAGEVIAEIETDKTTFEITAPVSGTILEVFFTQGSLVPVFTNLCVIGDPGEDTGAFGPSPADRAPEPAPPSAAVLGSGEKIAQRMRESLSTTAQYTLHTSAGAAGLLSLRARVKASADLAHITIDELR